MIKGYPEAECMTEIENEDALLLRDLIAGDEFILAVPHHQVRPLLAEQTALQETLQRAEQIESAPIKIGRAHV